MSGRRLGYAALALGVVLLCLSVLACDNTSNKPSPRDGSGAIDRPVPTDVSSGGDVALDGSGSQCKVPTKIGSGAVGTCTATRAYVTCTNQGSTSSYAATQFNGCLDCAGTCTDSCAATEYSLSCNVRQSDAGPNPTEGCRFAQAFPSGSAVYCCPCQ